MTLLELAKTPMYARLGRRAAQAALPNPVSVGIEPIINGKVFSDHGKVKPTSSSVVAINPPPGHGSDHLSIFSNNFTALSYRQLNKLYETWSMNQ